MGILLFFQKQTPFVTLVYFTRLENPSELGQTPTEKEDKTEMDELHPHQVYTFTLHTEDSYQSCIDVYTTFKQPLHLHCLIRICALVHKKITLNHRLLITRLDLRT